MNAPDPIDRVLNETIERGNALLQRRNDITAMVSWNRIREYRKAWPVLRNAIDYIVDLETIQQTREITTAEGMASLPEGSIAKDVDGDVWKKGSCGWDVAGAETPPFVEPYMPFTVLYEPAPRS